MRILLLVCLLTAGFLAQPACAENSAREMDAKFEQQLGKFDPRAVAAAKSYSKTFNTASQLEQMSKSMQPAIIKIIKSKNPTLQDGELGEFWDEFSRVALVDAAPVLEKWSMLNMLENLTTEEIVAADQFYSSDIGKSILSKMPKVMARMPEMIEIINKYMVPAGLAAAQAKLKAHGKDIKI